MVAEMDMPANAGVADGTGFNDLAGYIFGGNTARERMEMTTPVITTPGGQDAAPGTMQFVMENKCVLPRTPLHSVKAICTVSKQSAQY